MPLLTVNNLLEEWVTVGNLNVRPEATIQRFVTIDELERLRKHLVAAQLSGAISYTTVEDPGIPDNLEGATVEEIGSLPGAAIAFQQGGALVGTRGTLNVVSGATVTDNPPFNRVDLTVLGGGGTAGHAERSFSFVDYAVSPLAIGPVPIGSVIHEVSLEIITPFNVPTTLQVGDAFALGRFITVAQNDSTKSNTYVLYSGYTVPGLVTVLLTLSGPVPSSGTGKVTVHYS